MTYGCIGERLGHSFSREIHLKLGYEYELTELAPSELDDFFRARNFSGINVTIPYKERVIPYLTELDEGARMIGAVNTVVNRGGELYGYNTDFFGMSELIGHAGITVKGKKTVILGTGGTSKTARTVCRSLGASEILIVSRTPKEGEIGYEELYREHSDADIIINTTPVGMFPRGEGCPVDISRFGGLSGVVDAVYNPLRTRLIYEAGERGIPAAGGLYMLVAQAVRASEIFLDKKYPEGTVERVYKEIFRRKENIVLIGMPSSGKTTVGGILAERLSRELYDTDRLIEKKSERRVPELIEDLGEAGFRDIESEAVKAASAVTSAVIATGGGAILREENLGFLRSNGRIYFIDRPLSSLIPTGDRPLSSSRESLAKRYEERYSKYCASADVIIDANCDVDEVVRKILEDFCK